MNKAEAVLEEAFRLLTGIDAGEYSLDDALDFELKIPELRRTISDLLFHLFRFRRPLEKRIASAERPPRGRVRRVLLLVLTQTHFQTGIPAAAAVDVAIGMLKRRHGNAEAAFANAFLRKWAEVPLPDCELLPPAIFTRWKKRYPHSVLEDLRTAWKTPPELTARLCNDTPFPGNWRSFQRPWLGNFRFAEIPDPASFWRNPELLRNGGIYIQDPAAAAIPSLIAPRGVHRALDLCAAPGGKALMYRELLDQNAFLVAADRSARRQVLTRENFARRNLPVEIAVGTPDRWREKFGEFDLVAADVPCSNTGVFRRRPDALWRFSEAELPSLLQLQRAILEDAALLVARGGQLLYSTCSLEPEENFLQARAFEERHPEFRCLAEIQLLPGTGHDGTYACLWKRSE